MARCSGGYICSDRILAPFCRALQGPQQVDCWLNRQANDQKNLFGKDVCPHERVYLVSYLLTLVFGVLPHGIAIFAAKIKRIYRLGGSEQHNYRHYEAH
jgi:hypothetical protein